MRVGYLTHTGLVSGAERYLLALLRGLPDDISPLLLSPEGPLRTLSSELDVPIAPVPAVEPSFRLHPTRSLRGIGEIAACARRVRRLCRERGIDLLHANSTRAGLVAAAMGSRGAPPVVVTIHDCLPRSPAGRATRVVLQRRAQVALANSRYTASNFDGSRTRVVYPPVELAPPPDPSRARRLRGDLGIADDALVCALVGQITPWKGQETAIRALALVRERLPGSVLLLAGEVKFVGAGRSYDNVSYMRRLRKLREALQLGDAVRFLGEREDVADILGAADLLLAPSWEEPFGIAVGEAMLAGTAVIATAVGGPAEIIEDGVSGLLVAPRDPDPWAGAILKLARDRDGRMSLAERARGVARGLGRDRFVGEVLGAYRDALGRSG